MGFPCCDRVIGDSHTGKTASLYIKTGLRCSIYSVSKQRHFVYFSKFFFLSKISLHYPNSVMRVVLNVAWLTAVQMVVIMTFIYLHFVSILNTEIYIWHLPQESYNILNVCSQCHINWWLGAAKKPDHWELWYWFTYQELFLSRLQQGYM